MVPSAPMDVLTMRFDALVRQAAAGRRAEPQRMHETTPLPVDLHVLDAGGDGFPIVFLHGWACAAPYWDAVFARLPASYRGIAPDLRGFGRSPKPDSTYEFEEHIADLDALAERLQLGRFALVGNSMGGAIAMRYAALRPERVAAVVLVDTGAKTNPELSVVVRHPEVFRTGLDAAVLRASIRTWCLALDEATVERYLAYALESPGNIRGRALERHTRTDNTDLLARIAVPALVMWGERDVQRSLAEAEFLRAGIADAELVAMPDAAHCPFVDQPDAFVVHVTEFLARRLRP